MRPLAFVIPAALLVVAGCPEKKEPPRASPAPAPVAAPAPAVPKPVEEPLIKDAPAEVELFGTLETGKVSARRYFVYVSQKPCEEADATLLGATEHPAGSAREFFLEIFVPQGTQGHVCAAAVDEKGQQVGLAAYAKNPVVMQGQGEVIFKDVALTLAPVKARAAPKGLVPGG